MTTYKIECCCEGGGGPVPLPLPLETSSPFQLDVVDNKSYSGNIPPTPFKFDIKSSEPTDIVEFGDFSKTYGYDNETGIITINRTGTYRVTLNGTVLIENEVNPTSQFSLFLTEDPLGSIKFVSTLLFRPTGADVSESHGTSKIITVDTVPRQYQVFYSLVDPMPTETVTLSGTSFVPGSLTFINFQYINSKVQSVTDVRPSI